MKIIFCVDYFNNGFVFVHLLFLHNRNGTIWIWDGTPVNTAVWKICVFLPIDCGNQMCLCTIGNKYKNFLFFCHPPRIMKSRLSPPISVTLHTKSIYKHFRYFKRFSGLHLFRTLKTLYQNHQNCCESNYLLYAVCLQFRLNYFFFVSVFFGFWFLFCSFYALSPRNLNRLEIFPIWLSFSIYCLRSFAFQS